jgi:hypothetical protein
MVPAMSAPIFTPGHGGQRVAHTAIMSTTADQTGMVTIVL